MKAAQRDSDYAYRLAVDPPAAKELRLFGLADWTLERFTSRRKRLHELQYEATRLRERPLIWCVLLVVVSNAIVFWSMADAAADGRLSLEQTIVFAQLAVAASLIAFGGLNWALDGAAAPVAAAGRLQGPMAVEGALPEGKQTAEGYPAREIRFRDVSFAYPTGAGEPILDGLDLVIPAGSSLAIVGQNGAGKTTLAKLFCRLYDPTSGAHRDRRHRPSRVRNRVMALAGDGRVPGLHPLRDAAARQRGARRRGRRDGAGGARTGGRRPPGRRSTRSFLAAYEGGTDLSGGQWQRVALARALAKIRLGAGVVVLDEPTAQLDVRGEAEIFERILAATTDCTTILISHRFSTVRKADRICVLEHGRVIELGTHEELMALGGRYRTMFDLQAQRFVPEEEEGVVFDVLS